MLRTQLPLVWIACISTVASSARMSGTLSSARPVELDVLPRREMAVASVILAGDLGERPKLRRRDETIGNRDPQHRRMLLDIEAVLQAQRAKLVLGQFAAQESLRLVAKLRHPPGYEGRVEFVVAVHAVQLPI